MARVMEMIWWIIKGIYGSLRLTGVGFRDVKKGKNLATEEGKSSCRRSSHLNYGLSDRIVTRKQHKITFHNILNFLNQHFLLGKTSEHKKKHLNSGIARITQIPPPIPNSGNFTDFVRPSCAYDLFQRLLLSEKRCKKNFVKGKHPPRQFPN